MRELTKKETNVAAASDWVSMLGTTNNFFLFYGVSSPDWDVIFRNQIYGSQRMVVDEARHPAVKFPPPLPRNPNRDDRLWRMAEFLAMNHEAGRSIAWQSDMDTLPSPNPSLSTDRVHTICPSAFSTVSV